MLSTGPLVVIAFTVLFSVLTQKMAAFRAVVLGTLIAMLAFAILAVHSTIFAVYATLVVIAVGELIHRRAITITFRGWLRRGSKERTWDLRFCRWGLGRLLGGPLAGRCCIISVKCSTGRSCFCGR